MERFLGALRANPKIVQRALEWQERGRVLERFVSSFDEQVAMLDNGPSLIFATTPSDAFTEWAELSAHVEGLWKASVTSFAATPPVAGFLAITTIEEVAKLSLARLAVFFLRAGLSVPAHLPKGRRAGFFQHATKHLVAAASGALVNARMRRLYGTDAVEGFLADAETGRLVALREQCLYADSDGARVHLPAAEIAPTSAAWYVAVSGELLAEVQIDPKEWERLIRLVEEFRRSRAEFLPKPPEA
jgi:AbiV family abortive infection protein